VPRRSFASEEKRRSFEFAEVPKHTKNVPLFGGLFSTHQYHITQEGAECAKRILVVLAIENPLIDFMPILPDVGKFLSCLMTMYVFSYLI
jgi:hypothetical protein